MTMKRRVFPLLLAGGTVGLLLLGAPTAARAQRPFRVSVGGTSSTTDTYQDHGFLGGSTTTSTSGWIVGNLSYDLIRGGRGIGSALPPGVFVSLYYDTGIKFDFFSSTSPNYHGFGVSVRLHRGIGYFGAGLGAYKYGVADAYRNGLGGKLFAGLQGRGDLFLEVGQTFTGSPQSGFAFMVGVRL